mmetsp:Transcript_21776/g.27835  ORF Transcript_21776/g.27835 Transcript_21776/m.27835 type:complete len:289 (-) Transcript_21776:755-1621(-)
MSCVELSPLKLCGIKGECINETICVCNGKAIQNSEWSFYLNDLSQENTLPCYSNETLVKILYFLLGFFSLVALIFHVPIFKRSSLQRRILAYLYLISTMLLGFRRFANEKALFGQDTFHTLCFSFTFGSLATIASFNNERYLKFQIIKLQWVSEEKRHSKFHFAQKVARVQVTVHLLAIPFFFSTLFVPRYTASAFIKTIFGIELAFSVFNLLLDHKLLTWLADELKTLLSTKAKSGLSVTPVHLSREKVIQNINELKSKRTSGDLFGILNIFAFASAVASEFWLSVY